MESGSVANKLSGSPALLDDIARTLDAAGHSRAPVVRLPEVAGSSVSERLENLLPPGFKPNQRTGLVLLQ